VIFGFGSTQDYKNSSQVIAEVTQSGLGLPDRDYYFKDDERSKQIRDEYQQHIGRMFELAGDDIDKARAEAKIVVALETKLAQSAMNRVQRRDPNATYNKMTVAQLQQLTPNISWQNYFKNINFNFNGEINVAQLEFIKTVNKELTATALPEWQTYLRWHVLRVNASRLSTKFVDESFRFYGTVLTGAKENLERWKRCVTTTDDYLGEALGQVYVEKYFSPKAKSRALEMVKNLQLALREDLTSLSWMGDKTRKEALTKLDAIINKIGYPDKWRDYSAVQVEMSFGAIWPKSVNRSIRENG
jgi:putative endopeptidase